jgi:hypothetical protein
MDVSRYSVSNGAAGRRTATVHNLGATRCGRDAGRLTTTRTRSSTTTRGSPFRRAPRRRQGNDRHRLHRARLSSRRARRPLEATADRQRLSVTSAALPAALLARQGSATDHQVVPTRTNGGKLERSHQTMAQRVGPTGASTAHIDSATKGGCQTGSITTTDVGRGAHQSPLSQRCQQRCAVAGETREGRRGRPHGETPSIAATRAKRTASPSLAFACRSFRASLERESGKTRGLKRGPVWTSAVHNLCVRDS